MDKIALDIEGVFLLRPSFFYDERGFFTEKYRASYFNYHFVQDNHSFSHKNVLRGMHLHRGREQAKLVSVLMGKIYDVVVDVRKDQPTYLKWLAVELGTKEQLLIPPGCAHGFCVLSEEGAHVTYKVSVYYDAVDELRFRYDDQEIGIQWPEGPHILSTQDANAPFFKDVYASV